MKPTMRRYSNDGDYWRIREFLREVLLVNDRLQDSWEVARFDYWRWHGILNMNDGTLEDDVFLWEAPGGRIVAVLNREAPGSVFLQIHPEYRDDALEDEMLSVAEAHLTVSIDDNRRRLHVWCLEEDTRRQSALERRSYGRHPTKKPEYQRTQRLIQPIVPAPPADGYVIRSLGDVGEHSARCRLSWLAFHENEPVDGYQDGWYGNVQRAPLYRRDLDLVAVAPDGEALFAPGRSPIVEAAQLGELLLPELLHEAAH